MSNLNKPAATGSGASSASRRPLRWYLWDGGFIALGEGGGEVPAHAHHAIQVYLAFEGTAAIRHPGGAWCEGRGLIVKPDVPHGFDFREATGALLFVDAESSEGLWLRSALTQDITLVPDSRLEACARELRTFWEDPLAALDPADLIRHCVASLCPGAPPTRQIDSRVSTVLRAIVESDDLRLSLESAAKRVHLSADRFAHLFKEQVGLPFRRYILWRKVTRAMLAIGHERSISEAAHDSDFADAAHLTRTFGEMFGMPPSVMMRGDFFAIPSPFGRPD